MSMQRAGRDVRTNVLLLRDVPEHGLLSMERFADELQRGFENDRRVRMRSTTLHESARAARLGLRRADSYATRFVRYPLAAARQSADVYHIVDHGYGHLAALLPRERTITSCHDLMLLKAQEGVAGFVPGHVALARFRWSTSYLKSVARVVTCSEATKRDLVRLRGVAPDRISVVPYGVSAAFRAMYEETRAALKAQIAPGREHLLMHVSTGDQYKNVEGTLRVLAALRRSGMDVALVRAGIPLRAEGRALATKLGIADRVVECGRVSDARLVELYNAADVLLFPSFYEGYGWPPLEAMACGTPVVTSDCPSLLEVCGDAALSAPARDTAALASAVRAILDSRDLASSLRTRGLERARRFTWNKTIAGFAEAYASVADGASSVSQGERACAA